MLTAVIPRNYLGVYNQELNHLLFYSNRMVLPAEYETSLMLQNITLDRGISQPAITSPVEYTFTLTWFTPGGKKKQTKTKKSTTAATQNSFLTDKLQLIFLYIHF